MNKRQYTYIHLSILIGLSILTIILFYPYSTEDSYITYRYAQNIIDGNGFAYNPGEHFLGTTAPFYALVLAFFGFLGFSIPSAGGFLSAFSLSLAVILLYLLTLKKGYPLVGLLCGVFIFLNPWFLQTFGSETYFQLLMIICAFYFYNQKKTIPTTIFCALAFLVRADGIIPAIIMFADYTIKNKKVLVKETILFALLIAPLFLFYYIHFNTFLPATLEAKQAQYASGLWWRFLPGGQNFAGLLLEQNRLLYCFIPLMTIGGISILLSDRIWRLMALWAIIHTLGYTLLKVSFYHWYLIPLIFLMMLMSAFSLHFIRSVPRFFKDKQMKKWNFKILNQEIKISMAPSKDIHPLLAWGYGFFAFLIFTFLIITLSGGTRAYTNTYKAFPFPKLELYTRAGKWIAENIPQDSSISALEVGYLGYYAQRKVIDLVGLVTPDIIEHIREKDFQWGVIKYNPDYFVYNTEFKGWLEPIIDQPWFHESYEQITEMNQPGYPFHLQIFKKVLPLDSKKTKALYVDSYQGESNYAVGEIIQGVEYGQTFYCHNNNLAQIKVMLATYNRENHQKVIFHLKKSPTDKEDIYTEVFEASSVTDNAYRSFDFPPIPDSGGKTLYFSFESPLSKKGDAITIWASDKDKYKRGTMYINGKLSKGDLRFYSYFLRE